ASSRAVRAPRTAIPASPTALPSSPRTLCRVPAHPTGVPGRSAGSPSIPPRQAPVSGLGVFYRGSSAPHRSVASHRGPACTRGGPVLCQNPPLPPWGPLCPILGPSESFWVSVGSSRSPCVPSVCSGCSVPLTEGWGPYPTQDPSLSPPNPSPWRAQPLFQPSDPGLRGQRLLRDHPQSAGLWEGEGLRREGGCCPWGPWVPPPALVPTLDSASPPQVVPKVEVLRRDTLKQCKEEVSIQRQVRHPFVHGLGDSWQGQRHLFIMCTYCSTGDLHALWRAAGCLAEATVRLFAAELVLVLVYLHDLGIMHRDVKVGGSGAGGWRMGWRGVSEPPSMERPPQCLSHFRWRTSSWMREGTSSLLISASPGTCSGASEPTPSVAPCSTWPQRC
uniref:Ribosomal protein S6 kinase related n=1 Tax=Serinus canaria TaxID=9135 RepID=A0A8C9MWB3_SERCA